MNVLLLLARGIEGTGNTRITIELQKYIETTGNNVKVIAGTDKAWGRRNMQETDFVDYSFSQEGPLDVKKTLDFDTCDVCIIMSVPAKKYPIEATNNFLTTLENLHNAGTRIVYMQVDNKIQSISRNFYGLGGEYITRFFGVLDKVIVHHKEADFCTKFIDRKVKPLMEPTYTMDQLQLISTDFKQVRKQFWKDDPKQKLDKSCWYIGRSAAWKGWPQLRTFHYNTLKDAGYITVAEGIERSINAKQAIWTYDSEKNTYGDLRPDNNYNDVGSPQDVLDNPKAFRNHVLEIYGPYIRNEALERLSKAKFGMFFTYTGPQFGGQIEITMLEIVASGTIPVIRKELYDSANFCNTRLDKFAPEDIGIVVYDENNPQAALKIMNKLNKDDDLYNTYRENAYKFFKSVFDRPIIMKKLFKLCLED